MNSTALTERITIILIPQASERLQRLEQRTDLSRTDLANRAITLYEFVDAQLRDGQEMIARNKETGEIRLVQLLGASEGQAAATGSACSWPSQAGPPWRFGRRHLRRLKRLQRSPNRLWPLSGLAGREVRTA